MNRQKNRGTVGFTVIKITVVCSCCNHRKHPWLFSLKQSSAACGFLLFTFIAHYRMMMMMMVILYLCFDREVMENLTFMFSSAEKRAVWEEAFNDAKHKLGEKVKKKYLLSS